MKKLLWKDLEQDQGRIHCRFYSVFPPFTQWHTHDFHELFLVVSGQIGHCTQTKTDPLPGGSLVFVRATDVHGFARLESKECLLVNTAFPNGVLERFLTVLNLEKQRENLLSRPASPSTLLGLEEARHAADRLLSARSVSTACFQAHLRGILTDWLARIVEPIAAPIDGRPQWLVEVCAAMQRKENFLAGKERLMQLSRRSPEHVARCFRKFLDTTPSAFVRAAKIEFAAEMLLNTNLPITEILLEAGFQDPAHFSRAFHAHHGCSPSRYREENRHARLL